MWIALLLGSLVLLSSAMLVAAIMLRGRWERMADAVPRAQPTALDTAAPGTRVPNEQADEETPQRPS